MKSYETNNDAEQIVIGSVFLDPQLLRELTVQPEHMSIRHHFILKTLHEMDKQGVPLEIPALVAYLGNDRIDQAGGIGYLAELAGATPTTSNINFYENVIIEEYRKRRTAEVGVELTQGLDPLDGRNKLEEVMAETAPKHNGNIRDSLKKVYNRIMNSTGGLTGIASGYPDLDKITSGFQKNDLIIIAARPSVGKTAFAGSIAINVMNSALKATNGEVGFFSAEMSTEQILERMIGNIANIDGQKMKTAKTSFSIDDWNKTAKAMDILYNADLKIFDESPMYLNYIWRNAMEMRRANPDGDIVIMVDYLQLVKAEGSWASRREEVEEVSRSLKSLAKKIDAPVIALAQLSRGVENRQDKRPLLSDLREGGGIEQDADIVAFLYREDYYDKETPDQNVIEVILAKHRNGPTGTVKLAYLKNVNKFLTIDYHYEGGGKE